MTRVKLRAYLRTPSLVVLFWELAGGIRTVVRVGGQGRSVESTLLWSRSRAGLCPGLRGWEEVSVHLAALSGPLLWTWVLSLHLGAEAVRSGHSMTPDVYRNLRVHRGAALCGPSGNHRLCRKCSHGRTSKQTNWSLMEKMVLGNFDFKLNSELFSQSTRNQISSILCLPCT